MEILAVLIGVLATILVAVVADRRQRKIARESNRVAVSTAAVTVAVVLGAGILLLLANRRG